jgi:hypothetical protein
MAGISAKPVKGANYPGAVLLATRLAIAAGGAVDATNTVNGKWGSWAKTATGEYTYTLSSEYRVNGAGFLLAGSATLGFISSATQNLDVIIKSEDYSAGTVVVRVTTNAGGGATDAASACSANLHIILFDSSVT